MTAIKLPARCDRAAVEALLPEFVGAQSALPIEIDATEVEQVGQAMLQLLVSARRSGSGAVIAPSAALRDAAGLIGLGEILFDGAA